MAFVETGEVVKESIVLLVLPFVAVAGRFWSRILNKDQLVGWDDWTILIALVFNIATCVVGLVYTLTLLGKDPRSVTPENRTIGLEVLFSSYFIFTTGVALVKTSALLFYARMFDSYSKGFRIALWVGHGLVAVWLVVSDILILTTCDPPMKIWRPQIPGKCHSLFAAYLVSGLGDTLIDLYILLLPVPVLWNLKLKRTRKLLISGAFALGYGSIVISIGRLVTILLSSMQLSDNTIEETGIILVWTIPEIGLGIITVCVPNYWQLWTRARRQGWRSLFSRRDSYARQGSWDKV